MGAKAVGDMRVGSSQWRKAVRPRACALRPHVTGLGVGACHARRHTVLVEACLGPTVAGLLRRAPPTVRRWGRHGKSRTTSRADTPNSKTVSLSPFQNEFSPIFQTEVLQTLNTKVIQQVTLYNSAKGSRGFTHWFGNKLQRKSVKNSTLVNSNPAHCFAFFITFHSKLAMPLYRKVVCLAKLHFFPIGWF
jgi:hypothetical protein